MRRGSELWGGGQKLWTLKPEWNKSEAILGEDMVSKTAGEIRGSLTLREMLLSDVLGSTKQGLGITEKAKAATSTRRCSGLKVSLEIHVWEPQVSGPQNGAAFGGWVFREIVKTVYWGCPCKWGR